LNLLAAACPEHHFFCLDEKADDEEHLKVKKLPFFN
tara:strand:+ start:731 stop:838 length:108 start_codon:yes stop_codon:yes gene_type:complete